MRLRRMVAVAVAVALGVAACSDSMTGADDCNGGVSTAVQEGNTIKATGAFNGGQPVINLTLNGQITELAATTYDEEQATFDIGDLDPGTYTVKWFISCFDTGEQDLESNVTQIVIQ